MNFRGFRIARVFNIDIEINWSLFIMVGLITWSLAEWFPKQSSQFSFWIGLVAAVFSALIFFCSIIFHEIAHSLTARIFNIRTRRITLLILGGIAQTEAEIGFGSAKKEFLIAIMGPVSSILLAGIFAGLAFLPSVITFHVFVWLSAVNVALAVFNLIPCFPMDGGRIFRAICRWITKDLVMATRIARDVSVILGILMIGAALIWLGWFNALWIGFIVLFIMIPAADFEYREAKARKLR